MKTGWAVDPVRAAGGRRRYNKLRQVRAEVRRAAIISYLEQQGLSLIARGTQRTLATYFGVSEATISRDVPPSRCAGPAAVPSLWRPGIER
jgi:hypothetical protein